MKLFYVLHQYSILNSKCNCAAFHHFFLCNICTDFVFVFQIKHTHTHTHNTHTTHTPHTHTHTPHTHTHTHTHTTHTPHTQQTDRQTDRQTDTHTDTHTHTHTHTHIHSLKVNVIECHIWSRLLKTPNPTPHKASDSCHCCSVTSTVSSR